VRKLALLTFVCLLAIFPAHICRAQLVTYPFEIFTENSPYADDPGWDLSVDVWNGTGGTANFTFYNDSTVQSSVAQIYFHDGALLGISYITEGPGTSFGYPVSPGDLPGGNLLDPPFVAEREFSIGSESPPPWMGVNNLQDPREWVTISFDLINGGTLDTVVSELNSGALRIGLHLIDLPQGYSESALLVPEPATVFLLGLGALALLRKRRQ